MIEEPFSPVTHEMIYRELKEIRRRSEERDSVLQRIEVEIAATKGVVEAWTTAQNVGKFAKWIAGIIAAIGATWVALKAMAEGLMQ